MASRAVPGTKRTVLAFASLYVFLAVLFGVLSQRPVFGILVAVPITASLALNYYLVHSSWARQLGERGRLRMAGTWWAIQPALITSEVLIAVRVPLWLVVPCALLCGGLAATAYVQWRSRKEKTANPPPPPAVNPPPPPAVNPSPTPAVHPPPPAPAVTAPTDQAADALAAADAQVLAASETAERTRDDRPYADAIARLNQVVTHHPEVPGGKFLLHRHRAQYLTFQAGRTSERLLQAAPADRRRLEERMPTLYAETEAELRAAIAAPPGAGRTAAPEYAALGLLLCVGAEQEGPDRTADGIRLLREALVRDPAMTQAARARIQLDLATALVIRHRLNGTVAERKEAEAILAVLTRPASPVAAEAQTLSTELAADAHKA